MQFFMQLLNTLCKSAESSYTENIISNSSLDVIFHDNYVKHR